MLLLASYGWEIDSVELHFGGRVRMDHFGDKASLLLQIGRCAGGVAGYQFSVLVAPLAGIAAKSGHHGGESEDSREDLGEDRPRVRDAARREPGEPRKQWRPPGLADEKRGPPGLRLFLFSWLLVVGCTVFIIDGTCWYCTP